MDAMREQLRGDVEAARAACAPLMRFGSVRLLSAVLDDFADEDRADELRRRAESVFDGGRVATPATLEAQRRVVVAAAMLQDVARSD